MSVRKIPDRYLTTTIHIFRESTVANTVGDLSASLTLAYASIKANVQSLKDDTEFEIQGRVHKQDCVAYINRIEDDITREIIIGDQVYDIESQTRYMVLGVENWQAANVNITDSHHVKIIMKALWTAKRSPMFANISAKAKIT